jgi:hypothetical protein
MSWKFAKKAAKTTISSRKGSLPDGKTGFSSCRKK